MNVNCACRKDGVEAAYRNDQRQEYVNNVAYKHGTGLGTAPWYGVPGTAYDFGKSKSAGPTYHTDVSHPNGYGYDAPLAQYHSQPAYGHGHGHGGGAYKSNKKDLKSADSADCRPASHTPHYDINMHAKGAAAYPLGVDKAGRYANVMGGPVEEGYGYNEADIHGYSGTASASPGYDKVGYEHDLTRPAGYVSGSYEAVGYGYMY